MATEITNMFCRLNDLNNEAAVETFLVNRLLTRLGYPDSRIRTKESIESLPIPRGSSTEHYRPDYVLLDSGNRPVIVVDAKHPSEPIDSWIYQVVGYAGAVNRAFPSGVNPVKYAVLCNGHTLAVYPWDSNTPVFYLAFQELVEGNTAFTALESNIAYGIFNEIPVEGTDFLFSRPELTTLTKTFNNCHDVIWKKEKQGPTWAFYEFVKIVFVKMREDRRIHRKIDGGESVNKADFVFSAHWIESLEATTPNPFDTILFKELREDIEDQIKQGLKKPIFAFGETLRLAPSTIKEVVRILENYDLHGIDEDLNGRMFETFLNATIRGKELGQYFTPRPIVRYMTMTSGINIRSGEAPYVLDGCCGTGGFLIEAMAILIQQIENYSALSSYEKEQLKRTVQDQRLYGVEANEDLSRVARLNMYLHGDGGSRIYHAEALDKSVNVESGISAEKEEGLKELKKTLVDDGLRFNAVLTNPPFSMLYKASDAAEKEILQQYKVAAVQTGKLSSTEKSSILFIERYWDLLADGGDLLTVIDDTILNGPSTKRHRGFLREHFIIRQVISLPFNAFFKAQANIKTSVLHLRKKMPGEEQGTVFMAIANNIGHDDHKRDTPHRDNLGIIASFYNQWLNGENLEPRIIHNEDPDEPLGCPLQIFTVEPEQLGDRLDAFYYAPELARLREQLHAAANEGKIELKSGDEVPMIREWSSAQVKEHEGEVFKYFEIGDVTRYGAIVNWREDAIEDLPSRGRLMVKTDDLIFAKNNSSRGTTVIIPEAFDGAIVTTGFIGVRPANRDESLLWWSVLSSEAVRKQVYYLAVSASQPEIRPDIFRDEFMLPYPSGDFRKQFLADAQSMQNAQNRIYENLDSIRVQQQVMLDSGAE